MNQIAPTPEINPSSSLDPAQFASADGQRVNLIGIPRTQLNDMLVERGHKPFRTKQLWQWLYWHGVTDFDAMTNLSKHFRQSLADEFVIERPRVSQALSSADGTAKWLLKFPDGNEVETVHIPEADRGTLCVSSQVGCTLTCKFCHTGTQKLVRNLTAAEVVGQMMLARDAFGEWPTPSDHSRMITNVVMMGMGEPLYNYDNVAAALRIVMDGEGLSLSKRRITLSTSGVVPAMRQCGEELNVNLAVSLHAVDNDTRDHIMPINKKYPLEELLDACRSYPGVTNARRITFEYVMLKGVNDSDADARQLVRLLKGIPSKINLIPFNPWPGSDFECSSATRTAAFQTIIQEAGLSAPVRTTRGEDILAACGQLKSESQKLRRSERDRLEAAHLAAQVSAVD
ncbi:MAG: 23S rRNA (adenine(2503)-C(2))-methyltransferase RlmN [Kiloniella sp.]|nr:23S rRNA (adenine(2503)-C(2))-methyltransferase RlmN [Kiloniella sp.]RZO32203.1 MAG: 23S rRNA (adenine(2503)-C(2))-methyltransferase RlmN [Rhodospirillaceae bacterium]